MVTDDPRTTEKGRRKSEKRMARSFENRAASALHASSECGFRTKAASFIFIFVIKDYSGGPLWLGGLRN